jgi:NitT/TauT family transport system permease protein
VSFGRILNLVWPPLLVSMIVIGVLELVVQIGWVHDFILPPPSAVFLSLVKDREELFSGFFDTTFAAVTGLLMSFVIGSVLAIALSLSRLLRRAFLPYAIFFQTVPIVSIAPLLVIWFGFGRPTVIACAFIVSVFPVIASTLLGLQSTDPALLDLFRLYSATGKDQMLKLRIPFALPQIFSGLRISAGLAVIGAVVGEFIGGGGLGSVVDAARTQQRIDKVFAAVLLSSAIGLILVGAINLANWWMLRRWHASAQNR